MSQHPGSEDSSSLGKLPLPFIAVIPVRSKFPSPALLTSSIFPYSTFRAATAWQSSIPNHIPPKPTTYLSYLITTLDYLRLLRLESVPSHSHLFFFFILFLCFGQRILVRSAAGGLLPRGMTSNPRRVLRCEEARHRPSFVTHSKWKGMDEHSRSHRLH